MHLCIDLTNGGEQWPPSGSTLPWERRRDDTFGAVLRRITF